MKSYSVKVKQSPGWQQAESCIISISQGQENHEGEKLAALLEWGVANHRRCILNISDTLHRHNLMAGGTGEAEAFVQARRMGDLWRERNAAFIRPFENSFYRTHRWNDWLFHPDFETVHAHVLSLFTGDAPFRAEAEKDIALFTDRKTKQESPDRTARLRATCTAYLLEETAAYIIMSRTYGASRVYPAVPLSTFAYLRDHATAIPGPMRGMEKSRDVRVLLKRRREGVPVAAEAAAAA